MIALVLGLVAALVGGGIYLLGGSPISSGVWALVGVATFLLGERLFLRRGTRPSG